MLKNVVLPAPLGPMIETIERSGTANVTSLTAVRPPNCLVTFAASRTGGRSAARRARASRGGVCGAHAGARRVDGLVVLDALVELLLAPPLGQQALGSQDHHDHQQEPEDREGDLGRVEVQPELAREPS